VPDEVIQACGRHGLPLLAVPAEDLVRRRHRRGGTAAQQGPATEMTRVLGRRRLLLSAVAEGPALDAMFRLMNPSSAECGL
jgi:hypothetical protein